MMRSEGDYLSFTKLQQIHTFSDSLRGRTFPVNAVRHKGGVPMKIEPHTRVYASFAPAKDDYRIFWQDFFEHIGTQVIRINAVFEEVDVLDDPLSKGGTLEFLVVNRRTTSP